MRSTRPFRRPPSTMTVTLTAIVAIVLLVGPASARALTGATVPSAVSGSAARQEHAAPAQEDHAAQDEHAEEAEHAVEAKPWWHWPAKWINFLSLAALLYWMLVIPPPAVQDIFSFPGLRTIFSERAASILAARDLAKEQKQEAAALLGQSEQRLAKIAEEVATLASDARSDASREATRALEDGKAQAEKILAVARREVNQERVTAQRHLRGFVADLAVNLAEKNLAEHLTADDQDRLIREYLSRLGQSMA